MVDKKGLKLPKEFAKLTKAEEEVLHLLSEEYLTIKQITIRRGCSKQAVYKLVKNLRKKGVLNSVDKKVDNFRSTSQPILKRLHGQEFNIKILYQDQKYQKKLKESNILFMDGHTIRLHRNSIGIYSGEGVSFFGENEQRATSKSLKYWGRFLIKLENELKIILVKPRSRNIKIVNQHYASTNSEIYENSIRSGREIRVYALEDGKLSFITDNSFGFKEDETLHPITAEQDRKAVDKQINDWRLNNPPTNSELSHAIMGVTENQELYARNIKSHIKSIQDLGKGVKELVKSIKEFKNIQQHN